MSHCSYVILSIILHCREACRGPDNFNQLASLLGDRLLLIRNKLQKFKARTGQNLANEVKVEDLLGSVFLEHFDLKGFIFIPAYGRN
jgi:hypothetical protein